MKTLTTIRIYSLLIIGVIFMATYGCEKKENSTIPITDIDGNVYHSVTIGNQTWMVENLKTTRYNDGSAIPLIADSAAWVNIIYSSTPGYCWYKNNAANYKNTYGAIYNWYAINTGKLAPIGWHIPSDAEWTTLTACLGGDSLAGKKMKEAGTSHWKDFNTGDNISGFSALPGGMRPYDGSFVGIGEIGYWWSVTAYDSGSAWVRNLDGGTTMVTRNNYGKTLGCSIRCIKD